MRPIDSFRAHSARVYAAVLGSKDVHPVDQEVADDMLAQVPWMRTSMLTNRRAMRDMGHWLAAEAGIRQYLDIGTGLPVDPNLHQVVQGVHPEARVAYVDNDPIVLNYARALLTGTAEGRTAYIEADMREPAALLDSPELHAVLDLDQPVAVMIIAMLQFVPDARTLVDTLMDPLPSGSYLAITTATHDLAEGQHHVERIYADQGIEMRMRTQAEVQALFDGLDLIDPGVVGIHQWAPPGREPDHSVTAEEVSMYAGIARKP